MTSMRRLFGEWRHRLSFSLIGAGRMGAAFGGFGVLLSCLAPCLASETALIEQPSDFRLAGYGTLGWSGDNDGNVAAIRDISQRPKDSYLTGSTGRLDSRFAIQAAYRIDPHWSGVIQGILKDQVDHSLNGALELAYLEWQPTSELKLRGGRVGYDAFLQSDHRNLGYASTTVRPPTEFYGWIPIFSVNGADVTQSIHTGDADWKFKAQVGNSTQVVPFGDGTYDFKTDYLWSASTSRETGALRIKAAVSGFKIGSEAAPLAPLHLGLEQIAGLTAPILPNISAEATLLRNDLTFKGTRVTYFTLGASYDNGNWLAQSEIGRSETTTAIVPSSWMAYLLVGKRFGSFTPYGMLSRSRPTDQPKSAINDWSALGATAAGAQSTAYLAINSTRTDQQTSALGLRWDFIESAALKLQWDHVRIEAQGYGMWFRNLAINADSTTVDLWSVNLDFVF